MPISQSTKAGTAEPIIREPALAEVERVLYLFRNVALSPEARFLGAMRRVPVQRFVAAVAWWPEGAIGRFQLTCPPGIGRAAAAGWLLEPLAERGKLAGMESIQWAERLAEDSEWHGILRNHGFTCLHSERSFEVSYRDAWTRVMGLYVKHRAQIPAGWRTEAIRGHPPEAVLDLIAAHRLLRPAEVRNYWRANTPFGFDLDLSCILFDGERPFGAFLARRIGEGLCIDVQVVREANPRLRSLGDLLMLYHDAQRVAGDGPIRWIWFRSGEIEHRQTANLALRMRGQELPRCHLMGKTV
jgi:hypothetical protein